MRDLFPGYFHREPAGAIWKECIFSFDANFLLDFYRSTPQLQSTLSGILGTISDRSWLTHQAALEYYRNRETVIGESSESYDRVSSLVKEAAKNIENGLKQYQKHTAIEVEKITAIVKKASAEVEKLLQELKGKHPNHSKRDEIEEKLAKLFDGKVGPPYAPEVLRTVFQKAAQRFAERVPPGYKDENQKDGNRRFGDVVLWFQLLDIARERKRPLIFVTADAKEDWWTKDGRPRPELIHEMFLEAKVPFHAYKPAQFVTHASKFLDLKKEAKSVERAATELREIESQRQSSRETAAAFAHLLKVTEPNPIGSRTVLELLSAVKPDPSISAAFGSLANIAENKTAAAHLAELAKPNAFSLAASVELARLLTPNSILSAQFEEFKKSNEMANATVSSYLEALAKPSRTLLAELEALDKSNAIASATVSSYLQALAKPSALETLNKSTASASPAEPKPPETKAPLPSEGHGSKDRADENK
jgi:hypothetical protein